MGKRAGGEEDMMFEPQLKEYYLPTIIRNHMRLLGMAPDKIELFVKDVMSSAEKQNDYIKVIEEYNREMAR